MKRYRMISTATLATAVLALPALAQQSEFGPPEPRVYAPVAEAVTAPPAPDAIHSGANNPSDEILADTVAAAFAADRRLDGATITVTANNGRVSLSGSARTPEQAGHAENIAREIAGVTAVSGTLSSQGG